MGTNQNLVVYHPDAKVPLQVLVFFSASVGAVRFIWKTLRRGPSEEAEKPDGLNAMEKHLWRLYAETWDEMCKWDPINATISGDERFNGRLADLSPEARRNHLKKLKDFSRRLQGIKYTEMSNETEQTNHLFLQEYLRLEIKAQETFDMYEIPTHHLFGPHLMILQLPAINRVRNKRDSIMFVERLRAFERQTAQIIEAFRAGIRAKKTLHLQAVQSMIQQCQEQSVDTFAESGIYHMMVARFRAVGANVELLKRAVEECIIPSFKRLTKFLKDEYFWEARKHPGIWCMNHGNTMYRGCLEYFTSLHITPEEIHELGKTEVTRIAECMRKARKLIGDDSATATHQEYVAAMRENPANFYSTPDEILDRYQEILEKADGKLPFYFKSVPASSLLVKAIDDLQAEFAPPAHYQPPQKSQNKSAILFTNTSKPETRPKFQIPAIALHEGVPGHHLQLGLAQEKRGIPRIRRAEASCCLSFIQGWALYAEQLGEVMRLYEDPRDLFGRLLTEMWRAVRLVVDTGIHFRRWKREDAFKYLKVNACLNDAEINAELDRIITMPGQAIAYKVGQLRLTELRKFAERELDSSFTWQAFHEAVLSNGTTPLSVVDRNVTKWVNSEQKEGSRDRRSSRGSGSLEDQLQFSRRNFSRNTGGSRYSK